MSQIDTKADAAAREKIITARVGLLMHNPFFGNLATRLRLVNADSWCSTAATDGRHLFYNTKFVDQLPMDQLMFLVAHEILHVVYDHIGRTGTRDRQWANIAQDFAVNNDLIKNRVGSRITVVEILYDPRFDGMCFEQIYDIIYDEHKGNVPQVYLSRMLDEHLDERLPEDTSDRPDLDPQDLENLRNEMIEAVLSAARTCEEDQVPGNVRRMINDWTEPKVNWRELITHRVSSAVVCDYTWMRSSRRSWHLDAVLPGNNREDAIDIAISLDSSGSIRREMLKDFLGEVRGIMTMFPNFKIHLWCIDDIVYNYQVFTPDNIDEFDNYELMGCGGNTFEENWRFMREKDINPHLFIMFTDGYPCPNWCSPGDENYCDTVFLLHSTKTIEAPFGTTVYF